MSGYRVPPMKEIESLPWNGYKVVSTFSGGGGSCLGYRMAGYRVVWANEFVPAAQDTYRANHPDTFLNCQSIREVTPDQVIAESGVGFGEIDIFDGSPPCASFSTAGARERHWGHEKKYSDVRERTDDLFFEYARLVEGLQPKTFVAENVSGLVKGVAKGYFKEILTTLKACGYQVKARLLNSAYLGVPQARERLIFVGVRNDLHEKFGVLPAYPKPSSDVVTLGDALDGVENDSEESNRLLEEIKKYKIYKVLRMLPKDPPKRIGGDTVTGNSYFSLVRESMYEPCGTIQQRHGAPNVAGTCHPLEDRKFTIAELKRIMSLPDDFVVTGTFEQQWERLGRMVPPLMMKSVAEVVAREILDKTRV